MEPTQLLYTVPDAARLLAVCPNTVWALVARGEIQSVKLGRARRITRAELERYVAALAPDGAS